MDNKGIKGIHIVKPLVKWVGGKTQIIDKIIANFPGNQDGNQDGNHDGNQGEHVEINNYREAFLGGGSVLLAFLSYVKCGVIKVRGNIYAYDLNEPLIHIYKNIQTHHNELYDILQTIIKDFGECGDGNGNGVVNRNPTNITDAKVAKENFYYWIRSEYNKLCLEDKKGLLGSAMFIFLNKTCFRGMFRVGPKGFNVPYGNYKRPEIINKGHLEEIHNLIQGVVFECCDFTTSLTLSRIESNDFVYLDPPYAPEKNTSFVGYTESGFGIECHTNLFAMIHEMTRADIKVMLCNADVSLVRDNFTNEKYKVATILCKRSINSKNPNAKAQEVIITNY
jgi:DNA adenine methylase